LAVQVLVGEQHRRAIDLQIFMAGRDAPLVAPQLLRTGISLTAATDQRGFSQLGVDLARPAAALQPAALVRHGTSLWSLPLVRRALQCVDGRDRAVAADNHVLDRL
jgi:hypothetical protein